VVRPSKLFRGLLLAGSDRGRNLCLSEIDPSRLSPKFPILTTKFLFLSQRHHRKPSRDLLERPRRSRVPSATRTRARRPRDAPRLVCPRRSVRVLEVLCQHTCGPAACSMGPTDGGCCCSAACLSSDSLIHEWRGDSARIYGTFGDTEDL